MVSIVIRKKGNRRYYYLQHRGYRRQREIYLGKTIPHNIEEIKQRFLLDFYREEWLPVIQTIHRNYMKQRTRMPKVVLQKETENFATNFTYNTQRIEGSSLTLKDTAFLLEQGIAPANKPMRDIKEAEAHRTLFFEIIRGINKTNLSLQTVLDWHQKLFRETKPGIAGKTRD